MEMLNIYNYFLFTFEKYIMFAESIINIINLIIF